MANEIRTKLDAWTAFTITLAALASGGGARQSTIISNTTLRPAMLVGLKLETGAVAPTSGLACELFLIRGSGTLRTDNAGASDAAITIVNARAIGALTFTNTANAFFTDEFDTAPLGPLGTEFGIAVRNSTDQNLNGTEGNFIKQYALYLPEIQ